MKIVVLNIDISEVTMRSGKAWGSLPKETMASSEAKAIAEKARRVLIDVFRRLGHPIEADQLDADGCIVTEERLEELYQAIDDAGLQALGTKYEIVKNQ